jgi:thiamine biosynthesis protein ThiS
MNLTINGEPMAVHGPRTVADLLAAHELEPLRVVVERNGLILPREEYAATELAEGDTLEIVQMMAGG